MKNKTAVNMFEATMRACQQVKKENFEAAKATKSKNIKESKKKVVKKKKVESTQLHEDEDLEDNIDDTDIEDQVADDVSDDVIVVTDPDLSVDEYEDRLDDLQDIIDSTPEGEDPIDTEYVDDEVYSCPVCGNTFFSEDDMSNGGTCPVCGEEADAFVLVGKVADSSADDVTGDETPDDVEDDENLDVAEPEDDIEEESLDLAECDERQIEDESYQYTLDESRVNSFLTKFIKENYSNAKSMTVNGARIKGTKLTLECTIAMNSGKSKKVKLVSENFKPVIKSPFKILVKLDKAFKVESKNNQSDLQFNAVIEGKDIKVTGMKYKFQTIKEGKKYEVSNNYVLKESKTLAPKKEAKTVRKFAKRKVANK